MTQSALDFARVDRARAAGRKPGEVSVRLGPVDNSIRSFLRLRHQAREPFTIDDLTAWVVGMRRCKADSVRRRLAVIRLQEWCTCVDLDDGRIACVDLWAALDRCVIAKVDEGAYHRRQITAAEEKIARHKAALAAMEAA